VPDAKSQKYDAENMRELIVYGYRIIYRLQDDKEALIAAIIHAKRLLP
jgi:plasmid stabilization system protein ParE